MRYWVGFVCVLVVSAALPAGGSAQEGEEGAAPTSVGAEAARPTQSRLELWHPQAFKEPAQAAQSTVDIQYVSQESPEVTNRRRRRAIALGVTIPIVAVVGIMAGVWFSSDLYN
jgi:hypothetical protein